ncbi:hypothetical protein KP509_18G025400 [Ceratopteris richardii]|uniref:Homeobox domain-containing protein n=1 Tax=Ceratopteris richardii TaxID=49495 RepID=A0A8T2SN76_CERRI|nr:hypothetical protein KP509_18G025400 [Ceratopteris richardii]
MEIPGPNRNKITAKRTGFDRQKRLIMRPEEYNKLKLRTASGGSLTIRYRRRPSFSPHSCGSGSDNIFNCAASLGSFKGNSAIYRAAHGSIHQNIYFECDCEVTQLSQAFEQLDGLPEYSHSSCASVSMFSDDCVENLYDHNIHCSSHYCSLDMRAKRNYLTADSRENIQDLLADAFSINTQSFLGNDTDNFEYSVSYENSYRDCEDMEQSEKLVQQLLSFSADNICRDSTLLFMEDHQNLSTGTSWSFCDSDSTLTDASCLLEAQPPANIDESALHMSALERLPPLEDMEDFSSLNLIELPPLVGSDSTSLDSKPLLPSKEDQTTANDNDAVSSRSGSDDVFDGSMFLKLGQGMPDEVNMENSGMVQNPDWCIPPIEGTVKDVSRTTIPNPLETMLKNLGPGASENRHKMLQHADLISHDSSIFCLLDRMVARGKNKRKKRLRRVTPLHSLKFLLEDTYETSMDASPIGPDSDSSMNENVRKGLQRRRNCLLPEHAVCTLRMWFDDHAEFPFATKKEKLELVSKTGLTLTQVENWLSNNRYKRKMRKSDFMAKK